MTQPIDFVDFRVVADDTLFDGGWRFSSGRSAGVGHR